MIAGAFNFCSGSRGDKSEPVETDGWYGFSDMSIVQGDYFFQQECYTGLARKIEAENGSGRRSRSRQVTESGPNRSNRQASRPPSRLYTLVDWGNLPVAFFPN